MRTIPDAVFGINTYGKNWYIGLSIPQLLSTNVDFIDKDFYDNFNLEGEGALNRHYYVLGAYTHVLNPFWSIEPSMLLKNASTETQFDFGIKTIVLLKLSFFKKSTIVLICESAFIPIVITFVGVNLFLLLKDKKNIF